MKKKGIGCIVIPAGVKPWPHEMRVVEILADSGCVVEFLPTANMRTADALVDGVEFEIKSPRSSNANSLEHILKKVLKQSCNVIIDMMRIKTMSDYNVQKFLIVQFRTRRQIKRLILITKNNQIIDIGLLI